MLVPLSQIMGPFVLDFLKKWIFLSISKSDSFLEIYLKIV